MKTIPLAVLAVCAGLAHADHVAATGMSDQSTLDPNGYIWPYEYVIDVSGMQFNDAAGSALNQVLSLFTGSPGQVVRGIAWDVNLTTIGASWATEAVISFEGQVNLTVATDTFPVTNTNYYSGGYVYLSDLGIPPITVGADGILDLEFYDSYVDNAGAGDAYFEAGSTITITNLPSPSALTFLGLAGLTCTRRHR